MNEPPRWIAVGRITRAHGVKGEVAVLPLTEVESRFEPRSRVFLGESEARPLVVRSSRPDRGRLLVVFEGVPDRTAAERLAGTYVFVPASESPEPPEGAYWAHQLIGCEVVTEEGRSFGALREVVHSIANDVWVAGEGDHEVLVPALKDVVVTVDLEARRIVVRDVPGLTGP